MFTQTNILLDFKSCITRMLMENWIKKDNELHNLDTEIRLSLKYGEYKTFMRNKLREKLTLLAWWTKT